MSITFVTTTSYGTWLPGDTRGFVCKGLVLPGDSELLQHSRKLLEGVPVRFTPLERNQLFGALMDRCVEFGYRLSDAAVERWHLHWILFHGDDRIETVVGRLKTRMRQALGRGGVWTEAYCAEPLFDTPAIEQAQDYIARHDVCRMLGGCMIDSSDPQQSRGLSGVGNRYGTS